MIEPSADGLSVSELFTIKPVDVRRAAMDLLARREHSFQELTDKLLSKFSRKIKLAALDHTGENRDSSFDGEALESLIIQQVSLLASENLQSDDRFVEAFINGRKAAGKGPVRIRNELEQKRVDSTLIETYLDEDDEQWLHLARQVYEKKFGGKTVTTSYQEKAKRFRFMQYRGFPHALIQTLIK